MATMAAMAQPNIFDRDATSVCLRWDEPEGGAQCYALQMRKQVDDGDFQTLSKSVKVRKVRKGNLHSGALYEWRVAVCDGDSVGAWSPTLVAGPIDPSVTHQMEAPRIADYDGESATVHWLPETTIRGVRAPPPYALQYYEDDKWKLASDRLFGDRVLKHKLREGETYYFRIRPADAPNFEWSRASDPITVPRHSPTVASIFGPTLLSGTKRLDTVNALAGKIVAVYASASW